MPQTTMDPPRFVNHYSALYKSLRLFGLPTPWIEKPSSLLPRLPYLLWDTFQTATVLYSSWLFIYSILTTYISFQDLCGLGISSSNFILGLQLTVYHAMFAPRLKKVTDDMDEIVAKIFRTDLGKAELFRGLYLDNSKFMSLFTKVCVGFGFLIPMPYFTTVALVDAMSGNYRAHFSLEINSPFDDRQPGVYELVLLQLMTSVCFAVSKKSVTDCLFISLFRIEVDFLKYLSITMTSIQEEIKLGNRIVFKRKLNQWIGLHQDIVKNILNLIEVLSPVMIFYYVGVICNIVCAVFIQLKKDNDNIVQTIMMSVYIIGAMTFLFLLSNTAQQVTNEAQKLAFIAYENPWYDFEKAEADSIKMIITISNRTIDVTAYRAPVFLLNRETFLEFVATATSAFVTLSQMKDIYDE